MLRADRISKKFVTNKFAKIINLLKFYLETYKYLNKIVLFLYPNRFNQIDWERFELEYFLQEYKVYIYDLSLLLKSDSKR